MDINELLVHMITRQASDLYIKTESPPTLRIAGQLAPITDGPLAAEEVEELAAQLMQPRHKMEFELRQQVNLAYYNPTMGRYRVNIYMQRSVPRS